MSNLIKKLLIVVTLSFVAIFTVQALKVDFTTSETGALDNYEYIEDAKLASSRYTSPDDLSLVDPALFIEIENDDVLIAENANLQLYFNEEIISFKVLDKETGYVWSTSIDSPNAGTYTGLLGSGIGIEYIMVEKEMFIAENVGISDIAFTAEQELINDGIKISLDLGGYCATRACKRLYDRYVEGELTLEQMIEVGYTEVNVAFDLQVTLCEDGIEAYIPNESIEEKTPEEIQLASIILFPGLGATEMDTIPGYMVIPDGAGALIRYEDNQGQFKAPFEERFFGQNIGLISLTSSVIEYPLSMPIFGSVHGVDQNAFVGIIESGAFNARLLAYPNGAHNLPYNLIFPKFDITQVYRQSFSSDGSGGTLKSIKSSYQDIQVKYDFLSNEDANYVGIAKDYRNYLMEDETLTQQNQSGDINVFLEYLMSDSESSFFGNTLVEMSTVEQVQMMYDYFVENGLINQSVALTGWNDGGYSGHLPSDVDFENALGSNRSYAQLISHINETNTVMLLNDYVFASNATPRMSYRTDVAKGTNKFKIENISDHGVYSDFYMLYPFVSNELALKDYDSYVDKNVQILFEAMGSFLISYYYNGDYFFREDSYQEYLEVMEQYMGIANYIYPYSYAYKYTEAFYMTPLYNSQLKYYDDVVPLLQIVLKGSKDLYANYLNFNSLGRETILNLIDFGMNPSYVLTYEPSSKLKDTDVAYLYTTEFDLWKDSIVSEYNYINNALKYVNGQEIVNRVVLDYGVVKVTYSNDVIIYINYTSEDMLADSIIIPAMDYYVGGGN